MQEDIHELLQGLAAEEGGIPGRDDLLGHIVGEEQAQVGARDHRRGDAAQALPAQGRDAPHEAHGARDDLPGQGGQVGAAELDDLGEHQVEQVAALAERIDQAAGGVQQQRFQRVALRHLDDRQDVAVGVVLGEDRRPDLLLAGELGVDAAQGQPGAGGDLTHGGGVVALLGEEGVGGLDDAGAAGGGFLFVEGGRHGGFS